MEFDTITYITSIIEKFRGMFKVYCVSGLDEFDVECQRVLDSCSAESDLTIKINEVELDLHGKRIIPKRKESECVCSRQLAFYHEEIETGEQFLAQLRKDMDELGAAYYDYKELDEDDSWKRPGETIVQFKNRMMEETTRLRFDNKALRNLIAQYEVKIRRMIEDRPSFSLQRKPFRM